jgi:hypothetical protein
MLDAIALDDYDQQRFVLSSTHGIRALIQAKKVNAKRSIPGGDSVVTYVLFKITNEDGPRKA